MSRTPRIPHIVPPIVRGRPGRPGPCAFTLIDLLVVIAVIGLLVAVLLPALASSRRTARLTACLANVRSQGVMVSAYTADFKDALPPRILWWTEVDPDFGAVSSIYLINSFLARWEGKPWEKPDVGWPTPTGAWRCPEVRPGDDAERLTHSGVLHYAPNTWAFNSMNRNDDAGILKVWGDSPAGYEARAHTKSWHRSFLIQFPDQIVQLIDNVSYFNDGHGHRDARESIGLSGEAVQECKAFKLRQRGSHDRLARRPSVFFDNHAEALPSTPEYWLDEKAAYSAGPGAPSNDFYAREVQRFLWFVSAADRGGGGGGD